MSKEKINKSIDFSNLPMWKKGEGNHKEGIIKWINSIGYKIPFVYDDINGELEIIDYDIKTQYFIIKYNDKNYKISRTGLVRCCLGKILGRITKEFKIEIGQTFKDDKRDLTIIDREYRIHESNGQYKKWYKYHCNKCSAELWTEEHHLLKRHNGCSCCSNTVTVKGINDIFTTHPEMVKYFVNIEDTYTHTYKSGDKVLVKCPCCDYEKNMKIGDLYNQGIACPKCSDKISYCEKFMLNLLDKLKENNKINDYIYQFSKADSKWCSKYRYDFYFEFNDEKYIIETHGLQHYKHTGFKRTLEEEQQNDKYKYNLALQNGIKPENYIVIDCKYSKLEYIKNNILNSKLNYVFNLSDIDWNEINKKSQKSLIKEICDYWNLHNNINNEELSTGDLSKIFKLNRATIRRYLKEGTKNGWCYYDAEKEKSKKGKYKIYPSVRKGRNIICENKKFNSVKECSEYYNIKLKTMYRWLNHDCKMPKKFYDMELHYKDESMDNYEYFEIKEKIHNKNRQSNYKKVICITTGKVFNKIVDGANYYNCNQNNIPSCCKGRKKSCGKLSDGTKLVWKYIEDLTEEEYIKYNIENKLKELNKIN